MKKFLLLSVVLLFGIVVMTPGRAQATPVLHETDTTHGDSVDKTLWYNFVQCNYDLVEKNLVGIYATQDNAGRGWDNSGTTLTWHITYDPEKGYTYTYTWYTWDKELSHIIIELTDGITIPGGQIDLPDLNDSYSIASYYPGPGNPGMPGDLYGIKIDLGFNTTDYTFSFTTEQAPVWGNFYANGGGGTEIPGAIYAYNTGFDGYPGFADPGVFIAHPNGFPVPEPATMLLLGAGLIGLATFGRKKFFKR